MNPISFSSHRETKICRFKGYWTFLTCSWTQVVRWACNFLPLSLYLQPKEWLTQFRVASSNIGRAWNGSRNIYWRNTATLKYKRLRLGRAVACHIKKLLLRAADFYILWKKFKWLWVIEANAKLSFSSLSFKKMSPCYDEKICKLESLLSSSSDATETSITPTLRQTPFDDVTMLTLR